MGPLILRESKRESVVLSKERALRLIRLGEEFASQFVEDEETDEELDDSSPSRRRSVIECFPDPYSDGKWMVTVRNHIGAIEVDGQLIVVEPKIPLKHFAHIAKFGIAKFKINDDRLSLEEDSSFENLIATWFVSACSLIIPKDLRSSYEERVEAVSFVRGRPLLVRSSLMWMTGNLATECEFEEFDLNNSLNRMLKWGLHHVARIPTVNLGVRAQANGLANLLTEVSDADDFDFLATVTRETVHYSEAIQLVRFLRQGEGRTLNKGLSNTSAFLQYTPSIVEEGIRVLISNSLVDFKVEKSSVRLRIGSANPDLVFRGLDSVSVGDVKYMINDSGWSSFRTPAQQAVFFASAFQTYKSMVVAFSDGLFPIETEVVGNHAVSLIRWNVNADISPTDSHRMFLEQVREWISAIPNKTAVGAEQPTLG
jgi:hypothetical protein